MKLAIMQPYLFPYLGYFQMMHAVDHFVAFDDVNFIKGGWINRNRLASANQEVLFSLPLVGASQNKKISDVGVADDAAWRRKFLTTVSHLYGGAPHYRDVSAILTATLMKEHSNIAHQVVDSWKRVFDYLSLPPPILSYSSEIGRPDLKAQDGIIDICRRLGARQYINAVGGLSLYNRDAFAQEGIELHFIKANLRPYDQGYTPFKPGLSMIDVLMWNSREKVCEMLTDYTLV